MGVALWLAAALLIATAGVPRADEVAPIAQIKKVTGQVAVLRCGERRPAKVGDVLLVKDVIETGPDGAIGITFIDNTVFSAGPSRSAAPRSRSGRSRRYFPEFLRSARWCRTGFYDILDQQHVPDIRRPTLTRAQDRRLPGHFLDLCDWRNLISPRNASCHDQQCRGQPHREAPFLSPRLITASLIHEIGRLLAAG